VIPFRRLVAEDLMDQLGPHGQFVLKALRSMYGKPFKARESIWGDIGGHRVARKGEYITPIEAQFQGEHSINVFVETSRGRKWIWYYDLLVRTDNPFRQVYLRNWRPESLPHEPEEPFESLQEAIKWDLAKVLSAARSLVGKWVEIRPLLDEYDYEVLVDEDDWDWGELSVYPKAGGVVSHDPSFTLKVGDQVYVEKFSQAGAYLKVKTQDGKAGYCGAGLLLLFARTPFQRSYVDSEWEDTLSDNEEYSSNEPEEPLESVKFGDLALEAREDVIGEFLHRASQSMVGHELVVMRRIGGLASEQPEVEPGERIRVLGLVTVPSRLTVLLKIRKPDGEVQVNYAADILLKTENPLRDRLLALLGSRVANEPEEPLA